MSDKDRFMIVQVLPLSNYTQATANEVFTMTIGAYAWNETNPFGAIATPADCIIVDNGASTIKNTLAAAAASLLALSLY